MSNSTFPKEISQKILNEFVGDLDEEIRNIQINNPLKNFAKRFMKIIEKAEFVKKHDHDETLKLSFLYNMYWRLKKWRDDTHSKNCSNAKEFDYTMTIKDMNNTDYFIFKKFIHMLVMELADFPEQIKTDKNADFIQKIVVDVYVADSQRFETHSFKLTKDKYGFSLNIDSSFY